MTEDALVAAYSPTIEDAAARGVRSYTLGTVEFRPCACGTWMGMDLNDAPESAMRRHQATREHRAWRARRGL